jgi:TonB dependent receptor
LGLPQDAGRIFHFPDEFFTRTKYFAGYVRDRWQVTPKFTLSYGVRFDYYPFPLRVGRGLEQYDAEINRMRICGLGPNEPDCGIEQDRARFVPRLGIAYRLTDATVLRAGYGIATDPILTVGGGRRENYPDLQAYTIQAPNTFSYATTLRQGIGTLQPPDLSSGVIPVPGTVAVSTYDKLNFTRGYIQTWNLTLEQRIGGLLASAGYVATRAVNTQAALQQNWSGINGGTAGQLLNQRWGRTASTLLVGTMGTHKYDSLQVRAQGRFGAHQFTVGYTFGKALGYGTASAIPAYYRSKNYGPLANDITHNLQATSIVELPFGRGKRWAQDGIAAKLLGGWQLSGVFSAYSGRPFTATAANTTLNAQFSTQFADCVSAPRKLDDIFQWYDRSTFAVPPAAAASRRFGTCGPGRFRGPGLVNTDLGLERKIPLSERFELRVRAEMFNAANTPHHTIPNATTASVSNGTFMQVTDIANTGREGIDERASRFSLKLTW